MFLTGQLYPRPWEEPSKPKEQPKNEQKETHYTDQEIFNLQKKEQSFQQNQENQEQRLLSRERLNNRKTEREILQFKSNQYLEEGEVDTIGDMASNEPVLFEEMAQKRAKSFKDPEKQKQPNMQLWNAINQLPTKQINKVLRPKIIEMDKNACDLIVQKIEQDKMIENAQKQWFAQNRDDVRQKFIERHEKNISLEKKAGIKKEYQPAVTVKLNQQSGISIPNRPYSAYNVNSSNLSSKKGLTKVSNFLISNNQKINHNEGQVTFRQQDASNKELLNESPSKLILQTNDHQNIQITPNLNTNKSMTNYQIYGSTNVLTGQQYIPLQDEQQQLNTKQSEFRISTAVKPTFYKTSKTFLKLNQPKQPYQPPHPFMHQDFRGLFNADHAEALLNCNEYDPDKHSTIVGSAADIKKSFNTVRELFPMPQNQKSSLLVGSNSKTLTMAKTFVNHYSQQPNQRSRQQFQQSRQPTPISQEASEYPPVKTQVESQIKNEKLTTVPTPLTNNGPITTQSDVSQTGPKYDSQARLMRNSKTAANTRLLKRPFTAYRNMSYRGQGLNTPGDPDYIEQQHNASFTSANIKNTSRYKQKLQKDIEQAQILEQEKDECMSQMNWFEKVNHLDVKRNNRYPQIAYEEALHFDRRFAEHLARKKGNEIISTPEKDAGLSSGERYLNQKSSNTSQVQLNKSNVSVKQVKSPSGMSA